MKCSWKYCPHCEDDHWLPSDEAVRDATLYFHKDCFNHRNNLKNITRLWRRYIYPRAEKDDIAYKYVQCTQKRGMDGDLLLFGTKYLIKTKSKHRSPRIMFLMDKTPALVEAWEEYKKTGKIAGQEDDFKSYQ